jgi:hypothetical protein
MPPRPTLTASDPSVSTSSGIPNAKHPIDTLAAIRSQWLSPSQCFLLNPSASFMAAS